MKEKYNAPEIVLEELEKTDVLLDSPLTIEENNYTGLSFLRSIIDDVASWWS